MKNIYLIIGASGSGKTTVTELLARDHGLKTVWSYTTRPPRYEGEEGHIFVSDEEFDQLGEMCAYTEYNGYRYGVTSEIIDQNDIYVIDPPGVSYLKQHYKGHKGLVTVFLDISEEIRRKRMETRGDDPEAIERRLEMDRKWFDKSTFDFNLDFEIAERFDPDKVSITPWTPDEVAEKIMAYISMREEK